MERIEQVSEQVLQSVEVDYDIRNTEYFTIENRFNISSAAENKEVNNIPQPYRDVSKEGRPNYSQTRKSGSKLSAAVSLPDLRKRLGDLECNVHFVSKFKCFIYLHNFRPSIVGENSNADPKKTITVTQIGDGLIGEMLVPNSIYLRPKIAFVPIENRLVNPRSGPSEFIYLNEIYNLLVNGKVPYQSAFPVVILETFCYIMENDSRFTALEKIQKGLRYERYVQDITHIANKIKGSRNLQIITKQE